MQYLQNVFLKNNFLQTNELHVKIIKVARLTHVWLMKSYKKCKYTFINGLHFSSMSIDYKVGKISR